MESYQIRGKRTHIKTAGYALVVCSEHSHKQEPKSHGPDEDACESRHVHRAGALGAAQLDVDEGRCISDKIRHSPGPSGVLLR